MTIDEKTRARAAAGDRLGDCVFSSIVIDEKLGDRRSPGHPYRARAAAGSGPRTTYGAHGDRSGAAAL